MRQQVRLAAAAMATVLVVGTVGYRIIGLSLLDAIYQTVTTVTTVGFREVEPFGSGAKVFTIVLVLGGAGTALYSLGLLLESIVEGHLGDYVGRRRMDRRIAGLTDHVIVCGWGRVGRTVAETLAGRAVPLVVIDIDAARLEGCRHATVVGDATRDEVLLEAGIDRARALVVALATDAANLFVTLSARALGDGIFVVARCRDDSAGPKLLQAGADRVVNPQEIGGARMAAFIAQPHVAQFVDVVTHDAAVEFRLEEVVVAADSPLVGRRIGDGTIRERTGTLVLALRHPDGTLVTNPHPDTELAPGLILIAIGTADQLATLVQISAQR